MFADESTSVTLTNGEWAKIIAALLFSEKELATKLHMLVIADKN